MTNKIIKAATAAILVLSASAAGAGDFDGGYAGVFGRDNLSGGGIDLAAGVYGGYNAEMGSNTIAGVEIDVEYDWNSLWNPGGATLAGAVNGRVGYDMGQALVYGKAGVGYSTGGTSTGTWDVGVGAEVPVMNGATVRGEVSRVDPFAAGLTTQYQARAGIGYGF